MPAQNAICATYRLQLNKGFTFRDAEGLLDYFSQLGISHLYLSPILSSRSGSMHGYDVIDPTHLNPELGTEEDFQKLHRGLKERSMGLILDIVPNHMSASSENAWWMDVLENGPESAYAAHFDIDWHPPSRNLEGRILLPVLGARFAEALENQELRLTHNDGRFFVQYFDSLFPLAPRSYRRILRHRMDALQHSIGENSGGYQEYLGITSAVATLSDRDTPQAVPAGERRLQFEAVRERLRQLVSTNAEVAAFLRDNLTNLQGELHNPASFTALESLLDDQNYDLSYWQNQNEEINYRRFFTITDLVGLRVEDPLVFEATHALVLRLLREGAVTGLRIDHIDGLRDPLAYLNRLRERAASSSTDSEAVPIFVEKILARGEWPPVEWPIAGTTGYEFLNALNAFYVYPQGAPQIEEIYFEFLGKRLSYGKVLHEKKLLVMNTLLATEMRALGHQLGLLAMDDRYARDLSLQALQRALVETTANLGVYRTYIRNLEVQPADIALIESAISSARAFTPELEPDYFEFIADVLLLRNRPHLLPYQRETRLAFVMRWQQFTGPIMAKAFEDTFLYVYNPLISLNDVGGDPQPCHAVHSSFLGFINERSRHWPQSINTTTTHDTKRAEDVRARINVLSEIPEQWREHLHRWAQMNEPHKQRVDDQPVPDRNEEIFMYQTLVGMWPAEEPRDLRPLIERVQAYVIKATREAMVHTRWTRPNVQHEDALTSFLSNILDAARPNAFLDDFREFHFVTSYCGMVNGLGQTLLKIASPGTPDFYQGSELWDLRLVDPDNRTQVDFTERQNALHSWMQIGAPSTALAAELTNAWQDGRIKLYLIWKALAARRAHVDLFSSGDFRELAATGQRCNNVAAFSRQNGDQHALILVPRWLASAGISQRAPLSEGFWSDTDIRLEAKLPKTWTNAFTGEVLQAETVEGRLSIKLNSLLSRFPVALLEHARQ